MCGIVGGYSFNGPFKDSEALEKATTALSHRGPDDSGQYVDGRVGLGHRRLSIIDTSAAGHQPMLSSDHKIALAFNGEIYNYKVIRKALEHKGHSFRSDTDTEVLLIGYREYGKAILDRLNGFFAFAIYDRDNEKLFLARDRFGIKPLYWTKDEVRFLFSSELKALLPFGIRKELDSTSLRSLIQLSYIPAPWTIFKGCQKLLPGHYIEVDKDGIRVSRYYDHKSSAEDPRSDVRHEERLIELMDRSVERRLISDVPLGSFLSGGVDSSIIASIAARKVKGFKTFSIGFPDHPKYDESVFAERVARHIGSDHTTFMIREDDLKNDFFSVIDHLDEPFADSSSIPVHALSRRTREHVTVALSGDGADEVFSGYNKHLAEFKILKGGLSHGIIRALRPIWAGLSGSRGSRTGDLFRKLEKFAIVSGMSPAERYWFLASFTNPTLTDDLLSSQNRAHEFDERAAKILAVKEPQQLSDLLLNDTCNVLPNDMLKKVDSMSMAHALEVRTPFLDHEVVEFARSLPTSYTFGNGELKAILRSAYRDHLPKEVFERKKHGFEVPLLKWFSTEMYSKINEILNRDKVVAQGILNAGSVNTLMTKVKKGTAGDAQATIYALIVFQKWWDNNVTEDRMH